jgi:hypothetical protein
MPDKQAQPKFSEEDFASYTPQDDEVEQEPIDYEAVEKALAEQVSQQTKSPQPPAQHRPTKLGTLAAALNAEYLAYLSQPHPDSVSKIKVLSQDIREAACYIDDIYSLADRVDELSDVEQGLIISSIVRALDSEMRLAIIKLAGADPYCPTGEGPKLVNLFANNFTKYCVLLDELNADLVMCSMREILFHPYVERSGLWHNQAFHALQSKLNAVYGIPVGDPPAHSCEACMTRPAHIRTPAQPKPKQKVAGPAKRPEPVVKQPSKPEKKEPKQLQKQPQKKR